LERGLQNAMLRPRRKKALSVGNWMSIYRNRSTGRPSSRRSLSSCGHPCTARVATWPPS
jgi:hypothetical protein